MHYIRKKGAKRCQKVPQGATFSIKFSKILAFFKKIIYNKIDKLGFVSHIVRTNQAVVSSTFSKVALHEQWRGSRARSPWHGISFVSFSLCLFWQRKAAKNFWYQRSFNAFSFEKIAPKEKALQKENGRNALAPRGRPLLKKRCKTFLALGLCEQGAR